jgi:5-amino-6-(5-phosphoribosylamino)uracil reductase/diaminohydroxyphosphoribosylaminopyrimidine deaminase/5-amino-6-(5-phosphoribosylamino)uracil reductase
MSSIADRAMPPRRPVVTIAYAQTLDGRLATATGSSRWISGGESLRYTHALRAEHDAIAVGVGTVLADNPRLTVRLAAGSDPLRVVVDSTLRTPLDAAVLAEGAACGTLLAVTERAPAARRAQAEALGATVLVLPRAGEAVDLPALLDALDARGVRTLMVEGGARLITAFLRAGLAERLALTIAPKILGTGIEAVGDLGIRDLGLAVTLEEVTLTRYGADLVVEGRLRYVEAPHGG